jgi:hypothetical protein
MTLLMLMMRLMIRLGQTPETIKQNDAVESSSDVEDKHL